MKIIDLINTVAEEMGVPEEARKSCTEACRAAVGEGLNREVPEGAIPYYRTVTKRSLEKTFQQIQKNN